MERIIHIETGELKRSIEMNSKDHFHAIVESFRNDPPICNLGMIIEVIDGDEEPCYCLTEKIIEAAGFKVERSDDAISH